MTAPSAMIVHYDEEEDRLWIGTPCECVGEGCVHGQGDVLVFDEGVAVTVLGRGGSCARVTSIALLDASSHPMWASLFRGLTGAVRAESRVVLTFPCRWFERVA